MILFALRDKAKELPKAVMTEAESKQSIKINKETTRERNKMQYEIKVSTHKQIAFLKFDDESVEHFTKEVIVKIFSTLAETLHSSTQTQKWDFKLNNKSPFLLAESNDNFLKDYIAFINDKIYVNLGCCFFDFDDIKDLSQSDVETITFEIIENIAQMQPFIAKKYAKKCYDKIQEAKDIE